TTAYHVADTAIVLYRGTVVEVGDAAAVIGRPRHPYTRLLVDSIPWADLALPWGNGRPLGTETAQAALSVETGCPFRARCPDVMPRCAAAVPPLFAPTSQQAARCLLHEGSPRVADEDLDALLRVRSAQETSS
ncbi:MAG: hypothetical protein JO326_14185, partial [Acetobacteraceae bacterium]|nr:hypothetical protein [Acetobacteraceae bacterium]